MNMDLEERVRNALHEAGRAGPPDPAVLAGARHRARRRRRQRATVTGAVAATFLVVLAATASWPREDVRSVSADPAQPVPTSAQPTPITPPTDSSALSPLPVGSNDTHTTDTANTANTADTASTTDEAMAPVGPGNLIAVRADRMVVEIDPTTGAERARTMLSFTPANAELALGSDRSTIYATRRSTADDEQIDVVQVSPDGTETTMVDDVTAFALSPDGRRLAAAYAPIAASDGSTLPARIVERSLTNGAIDRDLSGSVRVWDHPGYERERIDALAYAPDGEHLAYVAHFETGNVRAFPLDGTPSPSPLSVQTGTANSFSDVGWNSDATLTVVNRCCGVESTRPPELVFMRVDGTVLSARPLDAEGASIAVGPQGWTAIISRSLTLQSSEETRELGPYLAAAF
ncbi:MAG: hypothetical protein AB7O92_06410 [Acidimicrobiia bacterium]